MLILRDLTSHSVVVPYRNRYMIGDLSIHNVASGDRNPKRLSEIKRLVPRQTAEEHSAQRFHEKVGHPVRPKV